MYEYAAKVLKVVDGDTLDFSIDLGLETFREIRCRLAGINSPEMDTPEGKIARGYLSDLIDANKDNLVIRTLKNKRKGERKEKYGRYLAQLFIRNSTGALYSINTMMLNAGHAKPYMADNAPPE